MVKKNVLNEKYQYLGNIDLKNYWLKYYYLMKFSKKKKLVSMATDFSLSPAVVKSLDSVVMSLDFFI